MILLYSFCLHVYPFMSCFDFRIYIINLKLSDLLNVLHIINDHGEICFFNNVLY